MNITINGEEFMTVCLKHKEAYWDWCPCCFIEWENECWEDERDELYKSHPSSAE